MIDKTITEIYKEAKYVVLRPNDSFRLKVGEHSSEVDELLIKNGTESAYFITPENPFSQPLCETENAFRHQRFLGILNDKSVPYVEGYGTDEDEVWGKERSYLLFSDDFECMQTLAAHFGQKGILQITIEQPVGLLMLGELRYKQVC